jgi:proteasome lid subunit RPN8/RPN11
MAIDCSSLELIRIARPACLAIIASACEVFPRECIGSVCCTSLPARVGNIVVAFPFQKADRMISSVSSYSVNLFDEMTSAGPWTTMGGYHSHTQRAGEIVSCLPSQTDLEDLDIGGLEIISRISHDRKQTRNVWKNNASGCISISWGKFQFLIAAYVRTEAPSDKDFYYIQVPIEFY